jgi:hypothetical protein
MRMPDPIGLVQPVLKPENFRILNKPIKNLATVLLMALIFTTINMQLTKETPSSSDPVVFAPTVHSCVVGSHAHPASDFTPSGQVTFSPTGTSSTLPSIYGVGPGTEYYVPNVSYISNDTGEQGYFENIQFRDFTMAPVNIPYAGLVVVNRIGSSDFTFTFGLIRCTAAVGVASKPDAIVGTFLLISDHGRSDEGSIHLKTLNQTVQIERRLVEMVEKPLWQQLKTYASENFSFTEGVVEVHDSMDTKLRNHNNVGGSVMLALKQLLFVKVLPREIVYTGAGFPGWKVDLLSEKADFVAHCATITGLPMKLFYSDENGNIRQVDPTNQSSCTDVSFDDPLEFKFSIQPSSRQQREYLEMMITTSKEQQLRQLMLNFDGEPHPADFEGDSSRVATNSGNAVITPSIMSAGSPPTYTGTVGAYIVPSYTQYRPLNLVYEGRDVPTKCNRLKVFPPGFNRSYPYHDAVTCLYGVIITPNWQTRTEKTLATVTSWLPGQAQSALAVVAQGQFRTFLSSGIDAGPSLYSWFSDALNIQKPAFARMMPAGYETRKPRTMMIGTGEAAMPSTGQTINTAWNWDSDTQFSVTTYTPVLPGTGPNQSFDVVTVTNGSLTAANNPISLINEHAPATVTFDYAFTMVIPNNNVPAGYAAGTVQVSLVATTGVWTNVGTMTTHNKSVSQYTIISSMGVPPYAPLNSSYPWTVSGVLTLPVCGFIDSIKLVVSYAPQGGVPSPTIVNNGIQNMAWNMKIDTYYPDSVVCPGAFNLNPSVTNLVINYRTIDQVAADTALLLLVPPMRENSKADYNRAILERNQLEILKGGIMLSDKENHRTVIPLPIASLPDEIMALAPAVDPTTHSAIFPLLGSLAPMLMNAAQKFLPMVPKLLGAIGNSDEGKEKKEKDIDVVGLIRRELARVLQEQPQTTTHSALANIRFINPKKGQKGAKIEPVAKTSARSTTPPPGNSAPRPLEGTHSALSKTQRRRENKKAK